MIWDLVLRLGGQMRMIVGHTQAFALGWDMTAVMALARALGLSPRLVAEMLPDIEAAAVAAINKGD